MKKHCTSLSILVSTLLCCSTPAKAKNLCTETRQGDFAIVKKLEQKGTDIYLTLYVVTIIEDENGTAVDYKNVNPELRTFKVDPAIECCIYVNQEQLNLTIHELLPRPEIVIEGIIFYDAKEGRVLSMRQMSCVG